MVLDQQKTAETLPWEGSALDLKKRKQEQLQKLISMIKIMGKKSQTRDQIRNNLSQMGWPDEALN